MTPASTAPGAAPDSAGAEPGEAEHVDRTALSDMLAVLGWDPVVTFIRDFISLWASRSERLARALADADGDEAHVVLLSIRSTCMMLGAGRLEAVAAGLHMSLRFGDLDGCREQFTKLADTGAVTCAELADLFSGSPATA